MYISEVKKELMAVVTTDRKKVAGAVPIFVADNEDEREKIAMYLARTLDAMVHDLENGVYYIVKH